MSAIDDYAERECGNREYFWNKPHSAGWLVTERIGTTKELQMMKQPTEDDFTVVEVLESGVADQEENDWKRQCGRITGLIATDWGCIFATWRATTIGWRLLGVPGAKTPALPSFRSSVASSI
jgi:hypothetical protein